MLRIYENFELETVSNKLQTIPQRILACRFGIVDQKFGK